jgi:PAS domain S-box-containing protein
MKPDIAQPSRPDSRVRDDAGILSELAETTAPLTGLGFLHAAVRYLAESLGLQAVFVAECVDYPTTRVRILAEWDRGRYTEPREFGLVGTPCRHTVLDGAVSCLPDTLLAHYPQYAAKERASYLGVPIFDADEARVIGHLALWNASPIDERTTLTLPLFRVFLSRIGAELRRKRADDLLRVVAGTLAPTTGGTFFRTLLECLARTLQVRIAFIAECIDEPPSRMRTLAFWEGDGFRDNIEFDLAGVPCERTVRERREVFIPEGVGAHYPQERALGTESYLGLPILDPAGRRVVGHLALLDVAPMPAALPEDPLLRIFLSRLGAELQRKRSDDLLQLVARATAPHTGDEFFQSLTECLATALGFKIVFITECADLPITRLRVLAHFQQGKRSAHFEYALAGSACEETVRDGRVCHYAEGVEARFEGARGLGVESYVGIPFFDPLGHQVIGHLAFLDDRPISPAVLDHPVVRIFASRAEAELRRKRADDTMWMVAQATAPLSGPAFFSTLVHHLAKALAFREVFITECVGSDARRVRMLSHWVGEAHAANEEYDLGGTPCELTVRERRTTFIGERLETMFACCAGDQAYLGLPVFDTSGERVIGHIAFYDDKPRPASVVDNPVFRILASRAGVELLRKRAEDDLRSSEAKYRLLVEHQIDLIAQLDREGRYRFVSPSFCRCFGRTEAELLGERFALRVHPLEQDAFDDAYAAVLAPPHRGHVEVRVDSVGGWRWIAWMFSAVPDRHGGVAEIIASGRDVTERKRAEEQAQQHLQTLAHVTRLSSMGEMASAIAHEVNQPLTAVVTYTQACMRLLRSGQASPEEIVAWMERAGAQAERASEIIRHLRTFIRKDEAQFAPLALNALVHAVARLVRPDAMQSGVDVVTDLAEGLPAFLGDGIQVQQVLVNLVRNAVEAIDGGGCERREVRVSTRRGADGTLEALVEDTGPGFDDEAAAQLFEPFFSTKSQGMGIGLSISRSIVEAHGGTLRAAPRPGGGALFCMALPPLLPSPEDAQP